MKNSFNTPIKLVTAIIGAFVFLIPSVGATVGGPTYIGTFNYNKANESVYYTSFSEGGRGCPPELYKISLLNEAVTREYSCDQGEKITNGTYSENNNLVLEEIRKITSGFKDLTPLSLPKNNIQVDIQFLKPEYLEGDTNWVIRSLFTATVYQNGIKVDEFPVTGCSKEQPFTFAGYLVPGFEKKIVLLLSAKSDCSEGGYTGESLYVIGGVQVIDKTHVNEYKRYDAPLVPSENTVVVLERDIVTPSATTSPSPSPSQTTEPTTGDSSPVSMTFVAIATIIVFALGLLIGKILQRRK